MCIQKSILLLVKLNNNNTLGLVLFLFTKPVLRGWVILLLVWGDDYLMEWRVMAFLTPVHNVSQLVGKAWHSVHVLDSWLLGVGWNGWQGHLQCV